MADPLSPDKAFSMQSAPAEELFLYQNNADQKMQTQLDSFLKEMQAKAEAAGLRDVKFVTSGSLMFPSPDSPTNTASAVSTEGTQYIILKQSALLEALSSDKKMDSLKDAVGHEMGHLFYGDNTAEGKKSADDDNERKKQEVRADLFSGGVLGTGKPERIIADNNDVMSHLTAGYNKDHPGQSLPSVTPLTDNELKLISDWSQNFDKRYPSAETRNEALRLESEVMREYEAQHGKPKTQSDKEKENATVVDTVLSRIDLNKRIPGVPEYDLLHDVDIKAGTTTPQKYLEAEFTKDPEAKRRLNEILAVAHDKARADGIKDPEILVAPTGSAAEVAQLASDTSREGKNYIIIDSNALKAALSSDHKAQLLIAGELHELGHHFYKDNSVEGNKRHEIPAEAQKAELRADLFSGGPLGNSDPALMEAALKEFLQSKVPQYNKTFTQKLPTDKPLTDEQLKLASDWLSGQSPIYPSFETRFQVLEMEAQSIKKYETEHGLPKTQKDKERENAIITTEVMQQVDKLNLLALPGKEADSASVSPQHLPAHESEPIMAKR